MMDLSDIPLDAVLVFVARLCLGVIFLPSALRKLANQSSFIEGTIDYQILPKPVARGLGVIIPWIELVLAVALILGVTLPLSGIVAALLLTSFIIAITINLRWGRQLECNCYGIGSPPNISWGLVGRNILLLLVAAIIIRFAPNTNNLDQWIALWSTDFLFLSSIQAILLLVLLLAFSIVTIYLVEWTVDIYCRVSRLQTRQN